MQSDDPQEGAKEVFLPTHSQEDNDATTHYTAGLLKTNANKKPYLEVRLLETKYKEKSSYQSKYIRGNKFQHNLQCLVTLMSTYMCFLSCDILNALNVIPV